MWTIKLAWKNLWRNRSRTLITVAAIFFAVILSTVAESLKQGVFENLIRNVVSFYTGYIQVHKAGYQAEQILDNSLPQTKMLESLIRADENVKAVTPRLESFVLASFQDLTKGCMITGISPKGEDTITGLKKKLVNGEYLTEGDKDILIAEGLANWLKLKTGDTLILIGQGYHGATAAGKYRVKGLLRFGSPQLNEKILFMSLHTAQEFLGAEGRLTAYILSVKTDKKMNLTALSLRETIGKEYEVMTWEELLPDIRQHIATDSSNMKVIQGVLYMLICFGIFSTLLIMMVERRYEMGMMVAIGMKKHQLAAMFVTESVLTVILGSIAGMIASAPLVLYLNRNPIRMGGETAKAYERFGFEAIFPTSTDASIFLGQALTVLVIGLVLALYPVWKVMRLNPVDAMKK
jgi:ABC-type lipoprotein release transport system permease subunit